MKILVCGAGGFIGRHLCNSLEAAGHRVLRGVRTIHRPDDIAIDCMQDVDVERWLPRLEGVDVAVNVVGILCEGRDAGFDAIHRDAPIALFKACEKVGVRRVVQVSALGGKEACHLTPYMRTKREADAWLMRSKLDWTVLRPSLVVGTDGDSSRFFRAMASLPVIGLPGSGGQRVQPVHVDDLCATIVRIIGSPAYSCKVLDIAGPEVMTYRGMLETYRNAMRLPAPLWLPVPMALMRVSAALAAYLPQRVFSPDTLRMLEEGSVADSAVLERILGTTPRGAKNWFDGIPTAALRAEAVSRWTLPMFRIMLAAVWIVTGILSLGLYPVSDSLALLRQVGLEGSLAYAALYGAAMLDCAFGIATLLAPGCLLWRMQFALIVIYSVIIAICLPQYWLHPFGPILKNLPILAMLIALDAGETGIPTR